MNITPIRDSILTKRIVSENDIMGCDVSGNLLDETGRIVIGNPCPFTKYYSCITRECELSSWVLFLMIGMPFLAIIILVVGVALIYRATKERRGY
jgi:hypothetical protein